MIELRNEETKAQQYVRRSYLTSYLVRDDAYKNPLVPIKKRKTKIEHGRITCK